ncbi:hypothetical protein PROFUN_11077 [Planoprotostelium fungivorum]|uniref:Uncharacterized protein n=1 Tax=Planoprotostelium fungivorum TaxID=1890364 RepID=A0A2P6NAJ8_9EUKA|nr:hypothetical protein PROFUN_11077 [Planoprotostelium fungivorum]
MVYRAAVWLQQDMVALLAPEANAVCLDGMLSLLDVISDLGFPFVHLGSLNPQFSPAYLSTSQQQPDLKDISQTPHQHYL